MNGLQMTVNEACERFRVDRQTLRRWVREGRLASLRIGAKNFVSFAERGEPPSDNGNGEEVSAHDSPMAMLMKNFLKIEKDHAVALRLLGQAESESVRTPFWRKVSFGAMTMTLLLATALTGGGVWGWQQIQVYQATLRGVFAETAEARAQVTQARTDVQAYKKELAQARAAYASERGERIHLTEKIEAVLERAANRAAHDRQRIESLEHELAQARSHVENLRGQAPTAWDQILTAVAQMVKQNPTRRKTVNTANAVKNSVAPGS